MACFITISPQGDATQNVERINIRQYGNGFKRDRSHTAAIRTIVETVLIQSAIAALTSA